MTDRIRTYSELMQSSTFEERFRYLALRGHVGASTFGFDRWINQRFYTSREWRHARLFVISRDLGCDLGIDGYEIHGQLLIHHMNPISAEDIKHGDADLLDPEFLITTTQQTHNAIHYGDERQLPREPAERRPGDTSLWTTRRKV
jgi:hypothetical protein